MSKILTASDRSALIKLASTLPKGSGERRAILAGLRVAGGGPKWEKATDKLIQEFEGLVGKGMTQMQKALVKPTAKLFTQLAKDTNHEFKHGATADSVAKEFVETLFDPTFAEGPIDSWQVNNFFRQGYDHLESKDAPIKPWEEDLGPVDPKSPQAKKMSDALRGTSEWTASMVVGQNEYGTYTYRVTSDELGLIVEDDVESAGEWTKEVAGWGSSFRTDLNNILRSKS